MGYGAAYDMAWRVPLEDALGWHLRANCYPPVPLVMVEAGAQAVRLVAQRRGGDAVVLPNGVVHRRYGREVPASELVGMLRLEAFVNAVATDGGEA